MNKLISFAILPVFISLSIAQDRSDNPHVSVFTSLAIAREPNADWYYNMISLGGNFAPISPGLGFGVGAEFGPLLQVRGATLNSLIEASFAQETSLKEFSTSSVKAGFQRMPIIVWAKIMSVTDLSPFLKFGVGYAKTDYRQTSSYVHGPNIRFHQWHLTWGLGGGFNYQASKSTSIEVFLDAWISTKDILAYDSDGTLYGFSGNSSMVCIGFRYIYSLQRFAG